MKKIFLVFLFILPFIASFSQKAHRPNPYRFAIGGGYYPNLKNSWVADAKFYNRQGYAFEFIGYNLQESGRVAAFFEPYVPISRDGKLRIVVGPGIHVGWWKEQYKNNSYESNPIIGVDAIMGLEYRIPHTPINMQIHWAPNFDLVGNQDFHYESDWAGAILRIAF